MDVGDHTTGQIDPTVDHEQGLPLPAASLPVGTLQSILAGPLDPIGPDLLPTIPPLAGPLDHDARLRGTHLELRSGGLGKQARVPGDLQGFDHPGRRIRPFTVQDPGSGKRRGARVAGVPFLPGAMGRLGSGDPHRQDGRPEKDQCGKEYQCETTRHAVETATATACPRGADDDLPTGIC